jgi:hypothetical protein
MIVIAHCIRLICGLCANYILLINAIKYLIWRVGKFVGGARPALRQSCGNKVPASAAGMLEILREMVKILPKLNI